MSAKYISNSLAPNNWSYLGTLVYSKRSLVVQSIQLDRTRQILTFVHQGTYSPVRSCFPQHSLEIGTEDPSLEGSAPV